MSTLQTLTPSPISQDDAEAALERFYPAFWELMSTAWKKWESIPPNLRVELNTRARANCVSSFIAFNAESLFRKIPGATIIPSRGMILVGVDGKILLRFKKLDSDKRYRNILTRQQRMFALHQELPGMPAKASVLVVGYLLNTTETGVEAVLVTCTNGTRLEFFFDVPKVETNVVELPLQQDKRKPRVRAIKIEKTEDGEK
jgi:hypothetical protein